MPFLPPNQQRQSTEGKAVGTAIYSEFILYVAVYWLVATAGVSHHCLDIC